MTVSQAEALMAGRVPPETYRQLLEAKFDGYLPDFIYRNLQFDSLRQTAGGYFTAPISRIARFSLTDIRECDIFFAEIQCLR